MYDGNTFGEHFKIITFGESHGPAIGCVIDGCPPGITVSKETIQAALNKRKPGTSSIASSRAETDEVEILSGIINDKTEGTPIALLIRNTNQKSVDYDALKQVFRPGHADFTYNQKYAGFQDKRGGGRSSGRETASRVAAGAVAYEFLKTKGISITAYTVRAASISITKKDFTQIQQNLLRVPDNDAAAKMQEKIEELKKQGDSAGGIVECIIQGCPAGLGEPVFDKLDACLAKAMLSIGAVKGIEFGDGFSCADKTGSQNNDQMYIDNQNPAFKTNHCGGIAGGLSTGQDIIFRIAVKPVPSISKEQKTIDLNGNEQSIEIKGRHDACLCPRIVPVVEAMAALVLADFFIEINNN